MEYINEVKLYGKVSRDPEYSHEYNGVPFYSIDLEVTRIKSNNKKTTALVRCYFRGDQLASNNISVDSLIGLNGKLVNSKANGLMDISVLVDNYEILESAKGLDSQVTISGEVTKIFTTTENYKGFINFVVAELDENGKRKFSSRVVIWNRLAEYVFNNLKIGDKVIIKGSISNSKTKSRPETGEPETVLVSEVLGAYFTKI